jgi:hypothetical protein
VEQDTLRRLDPEALEQLRVAHRELDHLADLLEFALEAADVLVGDVGDALGARTRVGVADLFGRLLADLDLGRVVDHDRSVGAGGGDLQRDRLPLSAHEAEPQRELDGLARGDGLAVQLAPDQRLDVAADADLLGQGDRHALGGADVRGLDLRAVVDTDAGLLAQTAVDPDDTGVRVLWVAGPDPRDSGAVAPLDPDEVAGVETEFRGGLLVYRREPAARVLLLEGLYDELHP